MEHSAQAKPYDIRERTFQFAVNVVNRVRGLPHDPAMQILTRQLVRAATSVGANVEEADGTQTPKDRINKWNIARKEARETRYWLRIIAATAATAVSCADLEQEAAELVRILSVLIRNHSKQ